MTSIWVIVGYGFREAVRRKMFAVVIVLTVAFLFLFLLANHYVFKDLSTITPPMDVPCPPIHLVADATTMSAPCSIGRTR